MFFICNYTFSKDVNIKEEKPTSNQQVQQKKKNPTCTATCSMTIMVGGISTTFETTGGNWFTNCETAGRNCNKKLISMMLNVFD